MYSTVISWVPIDLKKYSENDTIGKDVGFGVIAGLVIPTESPVPIFSFSAKTNEANMTIINMVLYFILSSAILHFSSPIKKLHI
jgi:hypothetical protein